MCWFFKKKKKSDDNAKFATKSKDENITANPVTINPNRPMESTVERAYEKDTSPKIEHSKKTEPEKVNAIDQASKVKEPQKTTKKKEPVTKYTGKYEIYPEAGSFKFRLKASNGEILAVSFRYTSEKGALSGIETFKKNVDGGIFDIYTDKSDFSQFVLYNSSKARVIIIGEFYPNEKQAESSVESVKKFYNTEKVDILKSIPKSEIREELIDIEKVEEVSTGKYEIYQENENYYVRLKANNAQVLFVSTNYASKASAKQGLETIKKAIIQNRFTVGKDKQNRYQFNLYSATNQLILTGEIYPEKRSCISAINSVRKFAKNAKIIEL
ncbi:MAG: DUF1508 domain-containing protein [Candidatus Izemoplasmatales bacterium]|nr:DUF1508 domain-containing protein [Candidatus Izemoplasmatales bacterium]